MKNLPDMLGDSNMCNDELKSTRWSFIIDRFLQHLDGLPNVAQVILQLEHSLRWSPLSNHGHNDRINSVAIFQRYEWLCCKLMYVKGCGKRKVMYALVVSNQQAVSDCFI